MAIKESSGHGGEDHDIERLRALSQRVEELTTDIGSVLHANTSILLMAQQTLDVAIRALGSNPFKHNSAPTVEEIDQAFAQPARRAARALDKFIAALGEGDRGELLTEDQLDELDHDRAIFADYIDRVQPAESRPSTLRTIACKIQDLLDGLPRRRLPREVLRNLRNAVKEVERCAALTTLLQTRSAILQMDYTIRSFREFVTTDVRRREPTTPLRVDVLLEEAGAQLIEYARSSNVDIRPEHAARDARVKGTERELVRALANLLHNAIKYSWHRDGGHKPWVRVRTFRDDGRVCIQFENWGVPISMVELQKNLIFDLGYRGEWSKDRGRLGTGIGLTDSRDIIERLGGTIAVTSRPARSWGPDDSLDDSYYRQPFITKVTVSLPEAV